MPKVVVYIPAEDARTIEAIEKQEIADWVREFVKFGIKRWHEQHAEKGA